jgi:hypothetical protein
MRIAGLSLLALALAALCTAPAGANEPPWWPFNVILPAHVTVVCLGPAGPDSVLGHCSVTVRDLANNPLVGSLVAFDFSACTDLRIAADQHDPRLVTHCEYPMVTALTDAAGVASFTVIGSGIAGPPSPANALRIYADGVLLGFVSVAVLDRDGAGGLSGTDLAQWGADFVSGTNPPRADLDGNGTVSGTDLSLFAAAYFSGHNVYSAGTLCP